MLVSSPAFDILFLLNFYPVLANWPTPIERVDVA